LVSYLADLKAVEAAPIVSRTNEADFVEISIQGDFEDFQAAVGLLEERLTPAPNYFFAI